MNNRARQRARALEMMARGKRRGPFANLAQTMQAIYDAIPGMIEAATRAMKNMSEAIREFADRVKEMKFPELTTEEIERLALLVAQEVNDDGRNEDQDHAPGQI